ncbi:MAG: hypothetical protein ACI4P4_17055, partial [Faecousia sp.]
EQHPAGAEQRPCRRPHRRGIGEVKKSRLHKTGAEILAPVFILERAETREIASWCSIIRISQYGKL